MKDHRLNVYIAAPFGRGPTIARGLATALENLGCRVVSSWIDVAIAMGGVERLSDEAEARAVARTNDRDLDSAHVVLVLAFAGEGREMFAEARMAVEHGIPVVWCGPTCLTAMRPGVVRRGGNVMAGEWEAAVKAISDAAYLVTARRLGASEDPVYTREAVGESLRGIPTAGAASKRSA